jgi:hypothetical protein
MHILKTKKSQKNDIMLHLNLLERQEQAKPKTIRREIVKIRAKIMKSGPKKNHTKNQNKKLVL